MATVDYASYKMPIRSALMKVAQAGEVTYYGVLGGPMGKPARWPGWKIILDQISLETANSDPNITYLVLNARTGWPGQIGFNPIEGKPTAAQRVQAQSEIERVFQRYCPGKPIPRLPRRKR